MIILIGASASGKTATALNLQQRYGLQKAITTTTREKRIGETHGVEYFFVSKEEFELSLKQNKFVEHTLYNNNYYGCGIDQVADNKIVVLDPNGFNAFKRLGNKNIVSFFLCANQKTREERMFSRGDNKADVKQRLINDVKDFSKDKVSGIDYIIETDNLTIDQVADKIFELYQNKIK